MGDFSYVPLIFVRRSSIQTHDRFTLAFGASVIGAVQGHVPAVGTLVYGPDLKRSTIKLESCRRKVAATLNNLRQIVGEKSPPQLILSDYCRYCPFSERCRKKAVADDDLSLLARMNDKTIARYHRKGIFTVKQLSYTFHPRRRNKKVKDAAQSFSLPLQALALRENTVYVAQKPRLPDGQLRVYVDMEGDPTASFVYLIGFVTVQGDEVNSRSLWVPNKSDEDTIFRRFLEELTALKEPRLYHYGGYEARVFKRILTLATSNYDDAARTLSERTTNILAEIGSRVYFPVYSNSLKEIGKWLGHRWSIPEASGLETLVWRARWEKTGNSEEEARLTQYNQDDCLALKRVTEFLYDLQNCDLSTTPCSTHQKIAFVPTLTPAERQFQWGRMQPAVEDFDNIIKCAYFDYQTSKVYIRTNPKIKVANRRRKRNTVLRVYVNKTVEHDIDSRCQTCGSKKTSVCKGHGASKTTIDLKFSRSGIKRFVTRHWGKHYRCLSCGRRSVPKTFKDQTHFGPGVAAWAMYQYVANRMSYSQIKLTARECFGISLPVSRCACLKGELAARYRTTVDRLLAKIVAGPLIHMDEAKITLKKETGYAFVATNMEEVVFMYRDSRKTEFLEELLRNFTGVLVTDFYTGYDFLNCLQQKCLVHLIRDLNEDVMKSPFDTELISLAQAFGRIMRKIIDTIDRFGLKARHLGKHRHDVSRWFEDLDEQVFRSDIAEGYRKRLCKNRDKLFVFLDHDGIPWNNNSAEHAIKPFAKYRRLVSGNSSEAGVTDYLVLLSLHQTCHYRGVRFLDFLLSGELDMDKFCQGQ